MAATERLTTPALPALLEADAPPYISLFMPTYRGGPETRQNPTQFQHLLQQAREQLQARGIDWRHDHLLTSADALLQDPAFWQHQDEGLAVYLWRGGMQALPLGRGPRALAIVAERRHILPVLPEFSTWRHCWLLALSQKKPRLFRVERTGLSEVQPADWPSGGMPQVFAGDVEQKGLQWHSETGVGGIAAGRRAGIFHGHGAGTDDAVLKRRVLDYCHLLSHAVHRHLQGEQAPLLVAGVDWVVQTYRECNGYKHLAQVHVDGSVDHLDEPQLHKLIWPRAQELFDQPRREVVESYRELRGSAAVSEDPRQIVPGADDGRVQTLLVNLDEPRWGRYDATTRQVAVQRQPQPGGDDHLGDLAATLTLLRNGRVFALPQSQMPAGTSMVAFWRY